ncbi:ATP-binding protein [Streptomyces ovatisporus]|uniref:ATP-binding protein n=1 Tax=Streptomyces ovatisporus TaxID=1128682 RepID=A0ABV9A3G2_9ACTN
MQVLQVQLEIGADPKEVGRARRWARSRLGACGIGTDEPLAETLLLLVSELVTNAVVHTGDPAVLRLLLPGRQAPGALRVEVADMSSCPPRQRRADGDDADGRGLELVSGLADRWGWQWEGAGKRIWCELDRAADEQGSAVSGVVAGKVPAGPPSAAVKSGTAGPVVQLAAGAVNGAAAGPGAGRGARGGTRAGSGAIRVRRA